jgi:hypothetical protein
MILRVGAEPPMITPYCHRCDMPVERFCMDIVSSPHHVGIHASCCGTTASLRLTVEQFFRARQTNEKVYVITSKTRGQGVQSMVKGQIGYTRQKAAG